MKIGKTTKPLTCLSYVNCITGNQVVDKPSVLIKLFLLINESEMIKVEGTPIFTTPDELMDPGHDYQSC